MTSERPRVAVTCGDPFGVGPEVGVVAAATAVDIAAITLIGDSAVWERAAALRGVEWARLCTVPAEPGADPEHSVHPEVATIPEVSAIATAVRGCLDGRFDAVVTGPIHKADLQARGFRWSGHTPYLAHLCGRPESDAVMMFAGGRLAVVLATVHVPLAEVPSALGVVDVVRAARAGVEQLRRGWSLAAPRVAVCGLNPHAGEGGTLGTEDAEVLVPAVAQLRGEGMDASGPHPADTLFARAASGEFDLVVANYHDQGLIPVKTLDFGRSVNITAGLPIVRTSVDHGTARDIAWTGSANASHAIAALEMAVRLA